uniref:50S ribosomal protein L21 n=1 Tax=Anthurium amnicola TaxID=1678845 RepID=A0A1D1YGB6_9ARAE
MKIDTKDIVNYTRKVLICLTRMTYSLACEHPYVSGMLFSLLTLYIFVPSLFVFLVSSSPTILCTALLLGTLLSFGQPTIPEIVEEKNTNDLSPSQMCSAASDHVEKKDESFSLESHIENRGKIEGTPIKEPNFTEQGDHVSKVERGVLLLASNEEEKKDETVVLSSALEGDKNQIHIQKKETDKIEVNGKVCFEKAESHEEYLVRDALLVAERHLETSGEMETENLKVEIHEPTVESGSKSPLESSQKLVNNHHVPSDYLSDCFECCSPDISLAGIIPMPDECHPLLYSEAPQPFNTPVDDSHPQDCNSDGDKVQEESEHPKETQQEKDEEAATSVTWTANDEKNLMDLSTSIKERSQRLESLIAKRRARKNLRTEAENVSSMDELSPVYLRIPSVSTVRRNPFDLSFDLDDQFPGSAPSVFLPRENLFDLPYDQADENQGLTGVSLAHRGSVAVLPRETFFRRYESFALGASFIDELREGKDAIKSKPYFATGRMNLEKTGYADFQRQFSEKTESTVSLVDMEYNELVEQELHQDSKHELVSPCSDVKHIEKESSSPDEIDSVESPCRQREINISDNHAVDVSTYKVFAVETLNDFVEYEQQVRREMDLHSPTSYVAKSDVTEMKYMELSSAHSLETSDKNFSTRIEETSDYLQQSASNYLKVYNDSVHSSISDSDHLNKGETVNDIRVVQPAYDFSQSAIGTPLLKIVSVKEDLLYGVKGNFNSSLSLTSETQIETLDMGSPGPEENNLLEVGLFMSGKGSTGDTCVSDDGMLCVLPSNLSPEKDELISRGADEIKKCDAIQIDFPEVNDKYIHPIASTLSGSATEQIMCSSSLTEIHPSEENIVDVGFNLQSDGEKKIVFAAPHSDVVITCDYFTSRVSENAHPSLENSEVLFNSDLCLEEHQVNSLLSVTRDSEDSKQEEEHEIKSISDMNVGLNVSQKTAKPGSSFPNIEHELSLSPPDFAKDMDDGSNLDHVPKNGYNCPRVYIPDGSFTGIDISTVEATERLILSERTKISKSDSSKLCSTDSKYAVQSRKESSFPELANDSDASDVFSANFEEGLLLEVDSFSGGSHVEELSLAEKSLKCHCQSHVSINTVSEEQGFVKSGSGPNEVSMTETPSGLMEISNSPQEIGLRSHEDLHGSFKHAFEATTTMETKGILNLQGVEGKLSEGTIQESSKCMESKDALPLQGPEDSLQM